MRSAVLGLKVSGLRIYFFWFSGKLIGLNQDFKRQAKQYGKVSDHIDCQGSFSV
jgi:hypothetical protein